MNELKIMIKDAENGRVVYLSFGSDRFEGKTYIAKDDAELLQILLQITAHFHKKVVRK